MTPWLKSMKAGKTAEAIRTCSIEIKKNPNNFLLYLVRGAAYADQKRNTEAMSDFNKSIQLSPDFAPAYTARCSLKRMLDDLRGAVADCTEAINRGDPNASPYSERGLAKVELRDYQGSLADFEAALKIDPESGQAYAGRGTARIELNDKEAGCLDLSKAGELGMAEAYAEIRKHCN